MVPLQTSKCIIQILAIICCIQVKYCYDFNASGTINLNTDNGWSQFGAACVGYLETKNFSIYGGAAGIVNVVFTAPINAPNDIIYSLVFYDDQNNSFPKVNHTDLTCKEKIDGNYKRLEEMIRLNPGTTWSRTVSMHQHIRTRWWYFYLSNCNESLIFPLISYTYSYRDNKSDTEICAKPSGITTTSIPINPTDSTTINGTSGDGSGDGSGSKTSGGTQKILMWIFVGIIIIVVIVLCIGFGINYIKKQRNKQLSQSESLLMNSLNDIPGNQDPYDLLKKWSLQQYEKILIDEKGYDDVEQWKDLNESDLQQMGFKEGHSSKFVKKVKEHFMDVLVEEEVADNEMQNDDGNIIKEEMVENTEPNNEEEGYTNQ